MFWGFMSGEKWGSKRFSKILNCCLLPLPFTYSGISIGANHKRKDTWNPIIRKLKKKLAPWKHKTLSFVLRVCLINSMLTSLSIFFLSFFIFKFQYLHPECLFPLKQHPPPLIHWSNIKQFNMLDAKASVFFWATHFIPT